MKKKLCLAAAALALLLAPSVSADWITAPQSDLTVSEGGASAHLSLSSSNWVYIDASVKGSGSALLSFYTPDEKSASLALSNVPLRVKEGNGIRWGYLSILPIINNGNGQRYYLIDTGTVDGCRIISYTNGAFSTVFSAADIPGDWTAAAVKVEKKALTAVMTKADGTTISYPLQWNKKAGAFQVVVTPVD